MEVDEGTPYHQGEQEGRRDHCEGHHDSAGDTPHPLTDMDGQTEGAVGLRKELGQGEALEEILLGNQFLGMDNLATKMSRRTLYGGQCDPEENPGQAPKRYKSGIILRMPFGIAKRCFGRIVPHGAECK